MGDMRQDLIDSFSDEHYDTWLDEHEQALFHMDREKASAAAAAVLDSIPPGSFKREDGTWVQLVKVFRHSVRCELHLAMGESEGCTCDTTCYTETTDA